MSIGHATYGAPNIRIFEGDTSTRLVVGNYSSLASTATFLLGGNHPLDRVTTYPLRIRFGLTDAGHDGYPTSKGDIRVGSDVWIGHEALVLSGVQIGDGAVVAARAVVTRDVPPFSIVAGNPARVIRQRVSAEVAERLIVTKWWDWPESEVLSHIRELSGPAGSVCSDSIFGSVGSPGN